MLLLKATRTCHVPKKTPIFLKFSRISTTNHMKINQNFQRSPELNGQIYFASQSRKTK
jgi:hypothetical protein